MPRSTTEPQEEEEIPPFLEALAISWGLDIPENVFYESEGSSKNEKHEDTVDKTSKT